MSRKKKLPLDPVTVTIESLAHDGRGVAHVDGKVVFIDSALPGEIIDFIYTDSRKDYAEGKLAVLHTRSKHRVKPACPHFPAYAVAVAFSMWTMLSKSISKKIYYKRNSAVLAKQKYRKFGKH